MIFINTKLFYYILSQNVSLYKLKTYIKISKVKLKVKFES